MSLYRHSTLTGQELVININLFCCFIVRCNYINFRRNAICLNCDHRRPKALNVSEFSVQPEDGKGKFVGGENVDSPYSLKRQGPYLKEWRFVDADEEVEVHEQLNSEGGASKFMDFPIAGGKSDLSRDVQRMEEWKSKMMERKQKGEGRRGESRDGLQGCGSPTKTETAHCAFAEEDMADWFGASGKL